MRILITGATGLVGTELIALLLRNGVSVHFLSTSKSKLNSLRDCAGFYWNPSEKIIDESAFIGVDVIIHLAGASISKRWTKTYKNEIYDSRIATANLLFSVLHSNPHQVKQLISASAVGIYPDSLKTVYSENWEAHDHGFLGSVVENWEAAADQFQSLGIKVCKLRTGLVLSQKGGALPEIAGPVRLGLGAAFGSGRQIQSWIHLEDLAAMYYFAAVKSLDGIYNAVAPNPVSNLNLTKNIASKIHKPLLLPNIPAFVMKIILGEMHQLLFSSQNVSAAKIVEKGFSFKYPSIEIALANILK